MLLLSLHFELKTIFLKKRVNNINYDIKRLHFCLVDYFKKKEAKTLSAFF